MDSNASGTTSVVMLGFRREAKLLSTPVRGDVTTFVRVATDVAAADFVRRLLTGEVLGVGVRFLVVLGGEDVFAYLFLSQPHAHELVFA
jgi:hypothetical protein